MIDNVLCLALDRRKLLWQDLAQQCKAKGWKWHAYIVGQGLDDSLNYNRIDVEPTPRSWQWGTGIGAQRHFWAWLSHKGMIRKAIKNGWENVLFLEDDAYLTERFNEVWEQVESELYAEDYDIIRLGWHAWEYKDHKFAGKNLEVESEYKKTGRARLERIIPCGGLFGTLINQRAYGKILQMPAVAPIDSQLNHAHDLKQINIVPSIIYVKSCWSSCENQFISRDEI